MQQSRYRYFFRWPVFWRSSLVLRPTFCTLCALSQLSIGRQPDLTYPSAHHCMLDLDAGAENAPVYRLCQQCNERSLVAVVHRKKAGRLQLTETGRAMVF